VFPSVRGALSYANAYNRALRPALRAAGIYARSVICRASGVAYEQASHAGHRSGMKPSGGSRRALAASQMVTWVLTLACAAMALLDLALLAIR
jgi:hypothetical protein